MSIEAMKQALEALELEDLACRYEKDPTPEHIAKAITALRTAIKEAEKQELNRTWTQEHWTEYERSIAATERDACAKICRSEAERALWNFQNDLPQNESFWNGAEQMASGCEYQIKQRISK